MPYSINMRLLFSIIILLTINFSQLFAQPTQPKDYGLKSFSIIDKKLGQINFYVSKENINKPKPLLIALDGSGYFPLVTLVKLNKHETVYATFDQDILALSKDYHVVLISKPGIKFCDTVITHLDSINFETLAEQFLKPTEEFQRRNSLYWRVNSASKVIDYLFNTIPIDKKKVIVYGYSEGGQVVPKLALTNKKITHCVSIVGGGLNQFYDFIIDLRVKAAKGEISNDEAQKGIDSLYQIFTDIYTHPTNTKKEWEDNTYLRWASYCTDMPLNSLTKLKIPIFMVACGNDKNSPVYGLDYVKLEFLRLGKHNLTYKVYPNCDHFFNETFEKDGKTIIINHKTEMINGMLKWLNQ